MREAAGSWDGGREGSWASTSGSWEEPGGDAWVGDGNQSEVLDVTICPTFCGQLYTACRPASSPP